MIQLYVYIYMWKQSTIMTNEHTSLEKYTSHTLFSKGLQKGWCWLCVRGGLETEQTVTYWPQVPLTIAALLPHSAGLLNRGPERPSPLSGAGSHCLELQLTQTICSTWLYNCLKPTCFPWASQLHWIQPVHRSRWYPVIFDRMHLLFTQVHLLIDNLVEEQYVTYCNFCKSSINGAYFFNVKIQLDRFHIDYT